MDVGTRTVIADELLSNGRIQAPSSTALPLPELMRIVLLVLSDRIAKWATLAVAASFFGVCVWQPSWPRLATAAAFTLLIHAPLWWRRTGR